MGGWGNSGYVARVAGRTILIAERKGTWLALAATVPFSHVSCGYVGRSDGWTDVDGNFQMDWEFDHAPDGPRWQKAAAAGAQPQRLLWASTGTKDPDASDVLYVTTLGAPDTNNTIPEATLLAFANHGAPGEPLPLDGGDLEKVIAAFAKAGIDDDELAADLRREGAESFVKSWKDLLDRIRSKHTALKAGG